LSDAPKRQGSELVDHAGVAFHPPLLLGIALLVGFAARWIVSLAWVPGALAVFVGPAVTAVSFGLFLWAVHTMRAGDASIAPSQPTNALVTRGPFRFSRNPIYVGMVSLQVGVGIWANSLWFLGLAAVSAMLLSWGVISREEQYLEREFGEEYVAYKALVRRWL
jgi:protein-S-isoprenylcysteine O-methyltransferase Ste14